MRGNKKFAAGIMWCCVFAAAMLPATAHGQAQETAQAVARAHADTSMTLRLAAAPAVVFPLFGPVREAEWSPHWNPKILFPVEKEQVAGTVFTTKHGDGEAVWVMDTYDPAGLRIVYVIVVPGMVATRLEISLKAGAKDTTEAVVAYHYTALSEAGDEFVRENAKDDPGEREHWEHALNRRLAEMKEK
jgi:hypothetical protein